MYELKPTKKEVEDKIRLLEVKVAELQDEFDSINNIINNGGKLNSVQVKRLSKIRKKSSEILVLISAGKEVLKNQSYQK